MKLKDNYNTTKINFTILQTSSKIDNFYTLTLKKKKLKYAFHILHYIELKCIDWSHTVVCITTLFSNDISFTR